MNDERKPSWLDLEDPINRALGVAAALYSANEDMAGLDGIIGAYQVLYDELRQIKRLFHAIEFPDKRQSVTAISDSG